MNGSTIKKRLVNNLIGKETKFVRKFLINFIFETIQYNDFWCSWFWYDAEKKLLAMKAWQLQCMLGSQIFDCTEYFPNIFYAIVNSILTDYILKVNI